MYNNKNNTLSSVRNLWYNLSTTQKIIIISIPVIMIIIVAISLLFIYLNRNNIIITNFSSYCSAPDEYKNSIELGIWSNLENMDNPPVMDEHYSANIRKDTYSQTLSGNTYSAEFIVDIPELEQSYDIALAWPTTKIKNSDDAGDYDISIACPYYTDIIYTHSKCRVSDNPVDDVAIYLPFESGDDVEVPFSLKLARYNNASEYAGETYISSLIYSCGNKKLLEKGKAEIADWFTIRYLELTDYHIEYTGTCNYD